MVGDELEPEDPLLLPKLELEARVCARLANVVDLGRLANVDDLAAPVDLGGNSIEIFELIFGLKNRLRCV